MRSQWGALTGGAKDFCGVGFVALLMCGAQCGVSAGDVGTSGPPIPGNHARPDGSTQDEDPERRVASACLCGAGADAMVDLLELTLPYERQAWTFGICEAGDMPAADRGVAARPPSQAAELIGMRDSMRHTCGSCGVGPDWLIEPASVGATESIRCLEQMREFLAAGGVLEPTDYVEGVGAGLASIGEGGWATACFFAVLGVACNESGWLYAGQASIGWLAETVQWFGGMVPLGHAGKLLEEVVCDPNCLLATDCRRVY